MKKKIYFAAITVLLFIGACKKDSNDDDNPGGGGNNDPVTITSTSPEYVVWGQEVSINGTGFSTAMADNYVWIASDNQCGTNPQDSTDWKKATVVSATATKLVIKLPYTTHPSESTLPCGPDEGAQLHVIVKGKPRVTAPQYIKTIGIPFPTFFKNDYPGYHGPTAMRQGDSTFLRYGGLSSINMNNSGYKDKIRLKINGNVVPVTRYFQGVAFKLPVQDFAIAQCTNDPVWGIGGEQKPFMIYFEGIEHATVTKNYFIGYFPNAQISNVSGPIVVSKSAGGNPFLKVSGSNMNFPKGKITPLNGCPGISQTFTLNGVNEFLSEFNVDIPLSLMNSGCSYAFRVIDPCGGERHIGNVSVVQ